MLLHECFDYYLSIIADKLSKLIRLQILFLLLLFKQIDDVLQLVSDIKQALKQVSQCQDLLILTLLIIPHDSTFDVLLVDHCLDSLTYRHLMIENHKFLIVRQEITYLVVLEKLANICLHSLNCFALQICMFLLLGVETLLIQRVTFTIRK